MEGFPVEKNIDSFWSVSVVSGMDGDVAQFEEADDDFLSALPLDDLTKEAVSCKAQNVTTCQLDLPVVLPEKFPFPFEPYDIQVGFMQNLYKALELGKIGIFESPTGTGKSLSLICGALRWLKDYTEKQRQELEALLVQQQPEAVIKTPEIKQETDWVQDFIKKKEQGEKTQQLKVEQELRLKRETRLKELKSRSIQPQKRKRDKLDSDFDELFKDAPSDLKQKLAAELEENSPVVGDDNAGDDDLILEDYVSDDDTQKENSDGEDDQDDTYVTKIYYCSRTHSQLSQFVSEIQKSPYGDDTQVISLASRQNMCINESVKSLKSPSLMNDRCLELQKNKDKKREGGEAKRKKKSGGCPYYKHELLLDYRDKSLVEVRDIEQLVTLGREMKACPYYGTRYTVPIAEVVALPYNTILHKSTRESCGVKLKDNIVIIDEAHNLLETIGNIHSVEVTGAQLTCAYSQLSQYQDRYRSRLKAKNLMYIRQLLFMISSFIKLLGGKTGVPAEQQKLSKTGTCLQTINDFLFDSHVDNMNLFKVLKYCEKSMIGRKLHGFVERFQPQVRLQAEEKKEEKQPTWGLSRFLKEIAQSKNNKKQTNDVPAEEKTEEPRNNFSSPLLHIQGFLEALTNTNKDGRMVINRQEFLNKSSLKFLLLNPAVYFESVVSEARAVIVAGGTMEPLSDFKEQLFYAAGVAPERILQYSCGHVIGADQLLPLALGRGPSGVQLDFTYQQRDLPLMMDELGRVLYNVCNIVPGGVVCFFPSYEYEKMVHTHWEKTGCLQKICAKKKLYREPKKANQVDSLLTDYTRFIKTHMSNKYSAYTGAVIFCVVGAKMSEGINFSDDLGRCVVMVGLPYPNMRSPELKEKMDYLNATQTKGPDGKLPGQIHYENLCMKAVNQSIGRAIRHKGDYATILLLDHRYLRPSMKTKLPAWIAEHLQTSDRFGPAFAGVRKFFTDRKLSFPP